MDVKIVFLNKNLEEVYMKQLKDFEFKDANKTYKLDRSIYGLKQISRSWNLHFDMIIKSLIFIKKRRWTVCLQEDSGSVIVILILYVDHILLIGNDVPIFQSLKLWLSNNFFMKDMGISSWSTEIDLEDCLIYPNL